MSLAGNQLFPSDNPWNHPITDAPVAANSGTLVASIGAAKTLHPDFGTAYNGTLNGIPYNVVAGSQPKVNVTVDAYPDESDLGPVPIPANAVIEGDAPSGVADYQQLPAYAQPALSGQSHSTWDTSSSDPRAVQDPLNPSNRVATTWYAAAQFTIDLNITDGGAHRIGLYLLDWDSQGRAENVSVLNADNGQVLASQSASNFSGGTWLVFDVTGHVRLQFTTTAGPNAVLSGLFFGAPGTPSLPASSAPAAAFVRADATTEGSWQGVYGSEGYFLPTVSDEGDRHLIVYDQTNNVAYELFNAHRPSEEPDGQWHADSEAVWNMAVDSFRTPGDTSADAAGLPVLPGLVRPDEALTQGAITHALRFTVPKTDAAYVFPASHEAGVNNPALPRMGERFRLDPNFNISGFPAADQVILQALKTYGMIVADNGSAWFLSGSPSDQWDDSTLHALTGVLGSEFQAVDPTPVVSSLTLTSGSTTGGTPVIVHGVNFTGVAGQLSVNFGGVPATGVTVIDDNTLTAIAPPHAVGSVDVTIATPYGTSVRSSADQFSYSNAVTPPLLAAAPVINGDNPNGLYNAEGQTVPGQQRSMVEDIVYTFSEPVTITSANQAFTLAVAGPAGGTLPSTLYAQAVAGSNGTQWAVSVTDLPEGTIGSIANGEYRITINPAYVFAAADGTTQLIAGRTDTFYRLYGDVFGTESVTNADYNLFKKSINTYNPEFDNFNSGTSSNADYNVFKKDLNISYFGDGFVTTI
jgi:hypothetical protein